MQIHKLISSAVIVAIALVLVFFFTVPQYQNTVELQNTLAQKQVEYSSTTVYYTQIANLLAGIQSNTVALADMNTALPPNISFSSIMYILQQEADSAGLAIKSISFSQVSADSANSQIKDIDFTMDVVGNYPSFKSFLALLDSSARLFEVSSISFSAANPSNTSLTTSAKPANKTIGQQPVYDFTMVIQTHAY